MDLWFLAVSSLGLLIFVVFTILHTFLVVPSLRQWWLMQKLPGPTFVPILGPINSFPFVPYRDLLEWMKRNLLGGYDKISAVWFGGLPVVYVIGPDQVEAVLSSTTHISKGIEYQFIIPWLQEGLLVSTGSKWHLRRKLLTPTFHFKILEDKQQKMFSKARIFVDKLLEEDGKPFDPFMKIARCTLDIISEAAMGVTLNSQDGQSTDYLTAIMRVTKDLIYRVLNFVFLKEWVWGLTRIGIRNRRDVKFLQEFTSKIVAERRKVYSQKRRATNENESDIGAKKKQAFLDSLLEQDMSNPGQWMDSDIREEVDTFLFEGFDTTSALIQFALLELGSNEEIQEMIYNEQYRIFGDDTREATNADCSEMKYLERFIKECLRLYPSVPYISRLLGDDLHLDGFSTIPAGTNIAIVPFFLHRNPKLYPNPEKFDPDRFLPDECARRHPFAYIPFSAGPRNCIGQRFAMLELKVMLSTVVRFSKIKSVTKRSDMKLAPFTILRPIDPIYIKVTPRL